TTTAVVCTGTCTWHTTFICAGGIGAGQVVTPTPSAITHCAACQTQHPLQCPSHTICTVCTLPPACPGGLGGGEPQAAAAVTIATICTQIGCATFHPFCQGGAEAAGPQVAA